MKATLVACVAALIVLLAGCSSGGLTVAQAQAAVAATDAARGPGGAMRVSSEWMRMEGNLTVYGQALPVLMEVDINTTYFDGDATRIEQSTRRMVVAGMDSTSSSPATVVECWSNVIRFTAGTNVSVVANPRHSCAPVAADEDLGNLTGASEGDAAVLHLLEGLRSRERTVTGIEGGRAMMSSSKALAMAGLSFNITIVESARVEGGRIAELGARGEGVVEGQLFGQPLHASFEVEGLSSFVYGARDEAPAPPSLG